MKRTRNFSRMTWVAAAAVFVSISGAGVAYAQEACPSVCYENCGDNLACQALQWMYGCARRICE